MSFRSNGSTPIRDLDEVISKLRFDGAMNDAQLLVEYDLIKLANHLALGEFAEIAACFAGGAAGMYSGHLGEVGALLDLFFDTEALLFGRYENVSRGGLGHNSGPFF